ncbi:MAG TPA: hypothetical protein VGG46_02665, partial [Terriglobales bacterium]
MDGNTTARRIGFTLVAVAIVALVVLAALNVGGLRARVLAVVFRTNNGPRVVAPPSNFTPTVPPGFHVSIFARGFK